jgi:hypothetical protein
MVEMQLSENAILYGKKCVHGGEILLTTPNLEGNEAADSDQKQIRALAAIHAPSRT